MKRYLIWIALTVGICGCKNNGAPDSNADLQEALNQARVELRELKAATEAPLHHLVFIRIKPEVDIQTLFGEIKELGRINEVKALRIGRFEDLGDSRAMAEYDLAFSMAFEDREAYEIYQSHAIHLALKEKLGAALAGPPVTYDFME